MNPTSEYRLSWEMIVGPVNGWTKTERIASGGDILDQYHTLLEWARTQEEPIRNVILEQRVRPDPESGWEPVPWASPIPPPAHAHA